MEDEFEVTDYDPSYTPDEDVSLIILSEEMEE